MVSKTNIPIQVLSAVVGGTAAFFVSQLVVGIDPPGAALSRDVTPPPAPRPSIATQPLPEKSAAVLNQLRVSNRSIYPIRVVLLPRKSIANDKRFHWDFAPAEGNQEGLVLSRPTGQLQLQDGDVLTAFALDGSRRYWGPYVVGQTKLPTQESPTSEWQLILTP
ncbi:hypothetical protein C1752_00689 [Acaryochloris thomasi RCC1774]|uniref:Uncharacterized protein n=1 Tax=Acaryochloris thomasi RCC1774 TaxID=1764569 RepID=A0A2W1JXQ0_9CYAN|nr:hypothetical protein [Acaryochloris thomasi]PZD74832.1 hypothetical protein C1752_00689 [Acaryochloris thomasi RCC1774]